MAIESGVRFTLIRDRDGSADIITYRGRAETALESVGLIVTVDARGAVAALDSAASSELHHSIARQAAALVRAAVRGPDGEARPPQKIVRWRATVGEKPRG